MDKISFPVSRFKPEYLQHIWDRIALFRTKKDERLLQDFDLFSEENIEQISEIEIALNRRFSNRFQLGKYLVELIDESDFIGREINQPYMWSWLSCVYLEQLTKNFSKVSRFPGAIGADVKDWTARVISPFSSQCFARCLLLSSVSVS